MLISLKPATGADCTGFSAAAKDVVHMPPAIAVITSKNFNRKNTNGCCPFMHLSRCDKNVVSIMAAGNGH